MDSLVVRGLDDSVIDQLRLLAVHHGRSLEGEIRQALEEYVRQAHRPTLLEATERFRDATGGVDLRLPRRD